MFRKESRRYRGQVHYLQLDEYANNLEYPKALISFTIYGHLNSELTDTEVLVCSILSGITAIEIR